MEAVAILRLLWHRRLLVAVGLVLALVVGIAIAYKVSLGVPPKFESRQYNVGIGSAEMLVDSPNSQVADLGASKPLTDVASLTARARLLANLMAISPLKEQIARRAGVDPRKLVAVVPSLGPQERNALDAASDGPQAITLSVAFNEALPIITANTQAPSPQIAARLAAAAVTELKVYLNTLAAMQKVPDARQLVVSPLGPARYATVLRGPRRLFAVAAVIFVFGLWCASLVIGAHLARSWREADEAEQSEVAPTAPQPPRPTVAPRASRVSELSPAPLAHEPSEEGLQRPERPKRSGAAA